MTDPKPADTTTPKPLSNPMPADTDGLLKKGLPPGSLETK
jgi:hypothetical protein